MPAVSCSVIMFVRSDAMNVLQVLGIRVQYLEEGP
jgi:hypothetical protein